MYFESYSTYSRFFVIENKRVIFNDWIKEKYSFISLYHIDLTLGTNEI